MNHTSEFVCGAALVNLLRGLIMQITPDSASDSYYISIVHRSLPSSTHPSNSKAAIVHICHILFKSYRCSNKPSTPQTPSTPFPHSQSIHRSAFPMHITSQSASRPRRPQRLRNARNPQQLLIATTHHPPPRSPLAKNLRHLRTSSLNDFLSLRLVLARRRTLLRQRFRHQTWPRRISRPGTPDNS